MPRSVIDLAGLRLAVDDVLAAVLTTVGQPIWIMDPDGVLRFANPAAVAALGYDRSDEPVGRDSPVLEPLNTGETVNRELDWFTRRDGSTFPASYVSMPIDMDGRRGTVVVFDDVEDRLGGERTPSEPDAILAAQQASLRRVATLVARGAASEDVFAAVAREVGHVIGLPLVAVWRYAPAGMATVVGAWSGRPHPFQVGTRWPLDGPTVCARVLETGRPVTIEDFSDLPGTIAAAARDTRIGAAAGAPIIVDGQVWGAMSVDSDWGEPLPDGIEDRLVEFTELIAATFSTTARQDELARLADEQAALRRVATLIAKESAPAEVFAKVAEEVAKLFGGVDCALVRYDGHGTATSVGVWGNGLAEDFPVGMHLRTEGTGVVPRVLREGRPCRIDDYSTAEGTMGTRAYERGLRSSVGCPILVRGRVWGALVVGTYESQQLPPGAETRLAQFSDLVATAVANAEARGEAERLAEEQAALRRVATLVAKGAQPVEVFDAVAGEMARVLDADQIALNRFEPDDEIVVLAHRGLDVARTPVGSRVSTAGESVTAAVRRTGRPARMEGYDNAEGALAELARDTGLRSSVSAPITVEGRLWGLITASWKGDESPPPSTEQRMVRFAQLLDTAIANADSRDQLQASRARLLSAGDEARRRVVRDLHDGAQQRMVHTIVTLKLARRALEQDDEKAPALVADALEYAEQGNTELRELAHGILPAVLTRGGLRAGVDAFRARLDLPVRVEIPDERYPSEIEASAYFIVAEALTNVAKHSRAARAEVTVSAEGRQLRVEVRDYGIGGADPQGHGLLGIADRVTALGGQLKIHSPLDDGTQVTATFPLPT